MTGWLHGRNKGNVEWVIFNYRLKDSEAHEYLWHLLKKRKKKTPYILHINDSDSTETRGKSTYGFERLLDQALSELLK